MELRNILAVVIGMFVVLVAIRLFGGDNLSGNASVDLGYQNNLINIKITSNANGILKSGEVIRAGASCSTNDKKYIASAFSFCASTKCKGDLNLNIATNTLNAGSSYKIRYKEFTSTGTLSSYRCSAQSFTK